MTETRPSWLLPPVDSLTEFPTAEIARQLSRICRYAGATPHFYSVARHSLLVAELVPHDPVLRLQPGDFRNPCERIPPRHTDSLRL